MPSPMKMACLCVKNKNCREGQKSRVVDNDIFPKWIMFSLRFHCARHFTVTRLRLAKLCLDYAIDNLAGPIVALFQSCLGRLALLAVQYHDSRFIITIVDTDWFRQRHYNSDSDKDSSACCFNKDDDGYLAIEGELFYDIDPDTLAHYRCD